MVTDDLVSSSKDQAVKECLNLENGTDRLFKNISEQLPPYAV